MSEIPREARSTCRSGKTAPTASRAQYAFGALYSGASRAVDVARSIEQIAGCGAGQADSGVADGTSWVGTIDAGGHVGGAVCLGGALADAVAGVQKQSGLTRGAVGEGASASEAAARTLADIGGIVFDRPRGAGVNALGAIG